MPWVFAHQGGWDELLMFAVPVALGWWAIKAAERRSRRRAETPADGHDAESTGPGEMTTEGPSPRDE